MQMPASETTRVDAQTTQPFIRLGCSLDALFDLRRPVKAGEPLAKGPAFSVIAKHAALNNAGRRLTEITLLHRLTDERAAQVRLSLDAYGLMPAFTPVAPRLRDHTPADLSSLDLLFSTHAHHSFRAIASGIPALYVNPAHVPAENKTTSLHVALDFDRVMAVACAPTDQTRRLDERLKLEHAGNPLVDADAYAKQHGLRAYFQREAMLAKTPAYPGPLGSYVIKFCALRDQLRSEGSTDNLIFDLVTARNKSSLRRIEKTLSAFNCIPDAFHSMGPTKKSVVLKDSKPDLFCDDAPHNIKDVRENCPTTLAARVLFNPRFIRQAVQPYT